MLIPFNQVVEVCRIYNKTIRGVFHVGAHECEELDRYRSIGISDDNIVWIEGNKTIADKMKGLGVGNIICELVDEVVGVVTFNITNNGQSSSILELGTHLQQHPSVHVVATETRTTKTIQDIQRDYNLDFTMLNLWNFDIQGVELRALKGAGDLLKVADVLYLEVNIDKLYKEGALMNEIDAYVATFGFIRVITEMTQYGWGDAVYIKV